MFYAFDVDVTQELQLQNNDMRFPNQLCLVCQGDQIIFQEDTNNHAKRMLPYQLSPPFYESSLLYLCTSKFSSTSMIPSCYFLELTRLNHSKSGFCESILPTASPQQKQVSKKALECTQYLFPITALFLDHLHVLAYRLPSKQSSPFSNLNPVHMTKNQRKDFLSL